MGRDLEREIDALRQRLEAIERHLPDLTADGSAAPSARDASPEPLPESPPKAPPTSQPDDVAGGADDRRGAPDRPTPTAPIETGDAQADDGPTLPPAPQRMESRPPAPRNGRTAAPTVSSAPASSPATPPTSRRSIEQRIGGGLVAWLGVVIVVIAVAFFLKYAYDRDWLGQLPPLLRCLFAAGFGLVLLAAGEVALRRVGRAAAAGLSCAGLGVLYLTVLSSFFQFRLVEETGAFLLLAAVAGVGLAITVRSAGLVVGVLSLLLGYLSPVLLSGTAAFAAALPLFLTALLATGLGLSAVRRVPFRMLRHAVLPMHGVVGTVWALSTGGGDPMLLLIFGGVWWAMVNAESLLAAIRGQSATANVIASLVGTAWFVNVSLFALQFLPAAGDRWAGAFLAAVACATAGVAGTFGDGLSSLRGRPRGALGAFTLCLWIQSGILLTVAIALGFQDYGRSAAWAAVGLGAVEAGRRLGSRSIDRFGVVQLVLALGAVCVVDTVSPALRATVWDAPSLGLTLSGWSVLALGTGAVLVLAAVRLRDLERPGRDVWRVLLAALAVVLLVAVVPGLGGGAPATTLLILVAAGLLLLGRLVDPLLETIGLFLLGLAAARWLGTDLIRPWADLDPPLPGVWPVAVTGAALAALALGYAAAPADSRTAAWRRPDRSAWGMHLALAVATLPALAVLAGTLVAGPGESRAAAQLTGLEFAALASWIALPWPLRPGRSSGRQRAATIAAAGVAAILSVVLLLVGQSITSLPRDDGMLWGGAGIAGPALAFLVVGGAVLHLTRWTGLAVPVFLRALAGAVGLALAWELTHRLLLPGDAARTWPAPQSRQLWWWLEVGVLGAGLALLGAVRRRSGAVLAGQVMTCGALAGWILLGTIVWRVLDGPAPVGVLRNLQALSGGILALVAAVVAWRVDASRVTGPSAPALRGVRVLLLAGAALTVMVLGTVEIERFFLGRAALDPEGPAWTAMARPTVSVWWAVCGIAAVVIGFAARRSPFGAPIRYVGLGLLGVTVLKFLALDLQGTETFWRVLALAVVGLLLVATSVVYWRMEAILSAPRAPDEP